jgi:formylglycine-generating enzyme required for sulfatase activity
VRPPFPLTAWVIAALSLTALVVLGSLWLGSRPSDDGRRAGADSAADDASRDRNPRLDRNDRADARPDVDAKLKDDAKPRDRTDANTRDETKAKDETKPKDRDDAKSKDESKPRDPPKREPLRDVDKFVNTVGMTMIPIPTPGKFQMGSAEKGPEEKVRFGDEDLHEVQITRPFHLAAHSVTVGQFRQFVEDKDYHGGKNYQTEAERDGQGGYGWNEDKKYYEGRDPKYTWRNTGWKPYDDDHPVVNVTWNDAVAYCAWLTKKEGKAGFEYRLPTEAEWEYACRAGTTTTYCTGDDPECLKGYANIADASLKRKYPGATYVVDFDDGYPFTSPVGKFKPNDWGLYDMHGNVWQWCSDRYGKYDKTDNKDPQDANEHGLRVLRGGSWFNGPRNCRAANRYRSEPADRGNNVGFRAAASAARTP